MNNCIKPPPRNASCDSDTKTMHALLMICSPQILPVNIPQKLQGTKPLYIFVSIISVL